MTSQRKRNGFNRRRDSCLYTGGTLAAEAAGLLAGYLGVAADTEHHHGMMLDADGHQIIDLGDDFYTLGDHIR
ncbi:membrane protein [Salmonella enterica subsp. enterica]|nr:membrane protein [Salmonella enterica subsp. enterica]